VNANPSVIDDSAVFAAVANISVRLTSDAKTAASKNHSAIFQPPRHHLFAARRARSFAVSARVFALEAHIKGAGERETDSGAEGECDPLAHTHTQNDTRPGMLNTLALIF
jgi:hypothetical protein